MQYPNLLSLCISLFSHSYAEQFGASSQFSLPSSSRSFRSERPLLSQSRQSLQPVSVGTRAVSVSVYAGRPYKLYNRPHDQLLTIGTRQYANHL